MNGLTLRPHQEDVISHVRRAVSKRQKVIINGIPGFGKTRVAKWMLGRCVARQHESDTKSGRYLFAVQRRGLVFNASNSFKEDPLLKHGVLMSKQEGHGGLRLQVGSIDTLNSWYVDQGTYTADYTFDLMVYDETHAHLQKFIRFYEAHEKRRSQMGLDPSLVIGLSATPSCKGIGFYDKIVQGPPVTTLQSAGYCAMFEYFGGRQGNLKVLKKSGPEFTKDSVGKAMQAMSGAFVRDWKKFAQGRPTIGFFPLLQHAREAQQELQENGIQAAYLDGSTPDDERQTIYDEFQSGKIQYICNVGVVERGTDLPFTQCIQLCTAIGSVSRYIQILGRGARVHPNKHNCLVLDHGGNVHRHGFFEDPITWSLTEEKAVGEGAAKIEVECPQCGRIYRGGRCISCEYEPPRSFYKQQSLEWDGTALKKIDKVTKQKPIHPEKVLVSALYACGKRNMKCNQVFYVYKSMCKQRGMTASMPFKFEHLGQVQQMPTNIDRFSKVRDVFPWTVGKYA